MVSSQTIKIIMPLFGSPILLTGIINVVRLNITSIRLVLVVILDAAKGLHLI